MLFRKSAKGDELQTALEHHKAGRLPEAERLYDKFLRKQPRHPDALLLVGQLHAARGDWARSIDFLGRAVAARPQFAAALNARGAVRMNLARVPEALADLDAAITAMPGMPEAWFNRGNALRALARYEEALTSYDKALDLRPDYQPPLLNRAATLLRLERPADALASLARLLAASPDNADALVLSAGALQGLGRHDESISRLRRALASQPNHADALTALATKLLEREQPAESLTLYQRALAQAPGSEAALIGQGRALFALGRVAEATVALRAVTGKLPGSAEAWSYLAFLLVQQHQSQEALSCCGRALTLKPDLIDALSYRALALQQLRQWTEAAAAYVEALKLAPENPDLLFSYGILLQLTNHAEEAASVYHRVAELRPDYDYIAGYAVFNQMQACDWTDLDSRIAEVVAGVAAGKRAVSPFHLLAMSQSAELHLRCGLTELARKYPLADQASWRPGRTPGRAGSDRIRLAYVSADFRNHATTHLLTELIELHDRSRFEVMGVSIGQGDTSDACKRIRAAFDRHIDVSDVSDLRAAEILRELDADIAIDLMGYTAYARFGLFLRRPAPVQVQYIGHPAFGAPCMDYLMVDRFVVPSAQEALLPDNLVFLPHTMQPNDRRRPIAASAPTRAQAGLPEHGFVFCCFNNPYKITPAVFSLWMRLLHRIDGSVLWLLEDNAAVMGNLRKEAAARGIAPERLIFAPRMPLPEHLARHALANLFLDTLPVNACTTASDALWAGLPVVTCAGESFTARIAGSLLHAAGLPDLVTETLAEYEALCLRLAGSSAMLAEVRRRVAAARDASPLFDSTLYCRHIESAYATMCQRQEAGLPPRGFLVPALG